MNFTDGEVRIAELLERIVDQNNEILDQLRELNSELQDGVGRRAIEELERATVLLGDIEMALSSNS